LFIAVPNAVTVLDAAMLGGDTDVRLNVFGFAGLLLTTRFKLAVLFAAAAAGGIVCLSRIHDLVVRPPGAHWPAEQAGRRMLVLCDAYKGPCTLEDLPIYFGDLWVATPQPLCRHNVWVGFVHVDGQMLRLIMNEKTGNIVYVLNGGDMARTVVRPNVHAVIENPAQAMRLSMHTVRSLQMIPQNADVALVGIPAMITREKAWHVTWQVWDKPMTAAYHVTVVLQQQDGRLMEATNGREETLISKR
jgi:hypothetical protein